MYQRNLVTLVGLAETEVELVLILEQIMILQSPKKLLPMYHLPKKSTMIKKRIVVIKIRDGIRETKEKEVEAAEAEISGKNSNKINRKFRQQQQIKLPKETLVKK